MIKLQNIDDARPQYLKVDFQSTWQTATAEDNGTYRGGNMFLVLLFDVGALPKPGDWAVRGYPLHAQ